MAGLRQRLEKIAASLMSGDFKVLTAPGKPELAYGIAKLVDTSESLEKMLHALSGVKQLAVDAEGINLGRTGKLCLLSVSPALPPDAPPDTPTPVFLVDTSILSTAAFTHRPPLAPAPSPISIAGGNSAGAGSDSSTSAISATGGSNSSSSDSSNLNAGTEQGILGNGRSPGPQDEAMAPTSSGSSNSTGAGAGAEVGAGVGAGAGPGVARCLKEMLECEQVTKLFYDVRCDSEALFHQYGVRLRGVVDLQLSEVAYRRYGPAVRRVGYVIGLKKALELYLHPTIRQQWQATAVDKRLLHQHFQLDPKYWDRRPLTEEQVRYAADDVVYLHHLHREFSGALPSMIMERVARFSEYRVAEGQQPLVNPLQITGNDPKRAQAPPGL